MAIHFLIGYMGSGKSTLGKGAAKALGWQWLDLDKELARIHNMSIGQMFSFWGEEKFRQKERDALHLIVDNLPTSQDYIFSCGGGTPCFSDNMEWMKQKGKVWYLQVKADVLIERLNQQTHKRPILQKLSPEEIPNFIKTHLQERETYYLQAHKSLSGQDTTQDGLIRFLEKQNVEV